MRLRVRGRSAPLQRFSIFVVALRVKGLGFRVCECNKEEIDDDNDDDRLGLGITL